MKNIFDSHVHSNYSFDAEDSITFLCERAVELGMAGICITDHCELREYEAEQYDKRIQQSSFGTTLARSSFNGKLTVMSGIEISDTQYDLALTERVLSEFTLDFVLASQHTDADGLDFYFADFKSAAPEEIDRRMTDYFTSLVQVAKWDGYDSLAHLTYPVRYITERDGIPVDITKYDDLIEQILRTAAQNGKALELNTSQMREGRSGEPLPPVRYIKRFRELGGEHITLGSDSHSAATLGAGIPEALRLLSEAGFQNYTVFKERQPLQFAIDR